MSAPECCGYSGCKAEPVGVIRRNEKSGYRWRRTDLPLCKRHARREAWPTDLHYLLSDRFGRFPETVPG